MSASDHLQPQQFHGAHPELVNVDALMRHREYNHGPGYSFALNGERYAPKRTPEEWDQLVESVRQEGVREPLHFAYNHKEHAGYIAEGNSRLAAAHEAGLQAVPVVGNRTSYVPDNPSYKLRNKPHGGPDSTGYFPGDFRVSAVLPPEYMHGRQ